MDKSVYNWRVHGKKEDGQNFWFFRKCKFIFQSFVIKKHELREKNEVTFFFKFNSAASRKNDLSDVFSKIGFMPYLS